MCVFALVCLARGPKITGPDSAARERSREECDHFCIHSPTFSPHHELGLRTSVKVSFGGELFFFFFLNTISAFYFRWVLKFIDGPHYTRFTLYLSGLMFDFTEGNARLHQ